MVLSKHGRLMEPKGEEVISDLRDRFQQPRRTRILTKFGIKDRNSKDQRDKLRDDPLKGKNKQKIL